MNPTTTPTTKPTYRQYAGSIATFADRLRRRAELLPAVEYMVATASTAQLEAVYALLSPIKAEVRA